jgi:hypothetical protein
MTDRARLILTEIETNPQAPKGSLPFIFNGMLPRWLGNVETTDHCDVLLIANRLSATFISKADVLGRKCFIAHG